MDKLVEISLEKSTQSINSACFKGKLNEINTKIKERFNELMSKLKIKLAIKIKNSLLELNENSDIKKFYEITKNMIFEIINSFFFLNSDIQCDKNKGYKVQLNDDIEYELSEASRIQVDLFVDDYFNYVIDTLTKKVEIDINIYTEEIVKEIIEKQYEFNLKNQNLLDFNVTKNELLEIVKLYITSEISKKLKFIVLKNAVRDLINPLIELFGKFCSALYREGMNKDNFIKNAKDSIKISFDELKKKIEEYNEKKKEMSLNKEEEEEKDELELDELIRENVKNLYEKNE